MNLKKKKNSLQKYTETDSRIFTRIEKVIHHGLNHNEGFIIHHGSEIGTSHHLCDFKIFSKGRGDDPRVFAEGGAGEVAAY